MSAPYYETPGVTGYRSLSEAERHMLDAIRVQAAAVKVLAAQVEEFLFNETTRLGLEHANPETTEQRKAEIRHLMEEGQRWRMLGTDSLQLGFMELTRSIARSTHF